MMSLEDYKPTIAMIIVQFLRSGLTLSGREAFSQGMSPRVFVVYRQCTAFLLIAPITYFKRSSVSTRGCLGWKNFWLIFLLSLLSITLDQNGYYGGLDLTSSSVASALTNLVPAITFAMAYTMGLEKVHPRSLRSVAKVIGMVICVTGAIMMALLKGPKLLNMEFLPENSLLQRGGNHTWILGCLFLFGGSCSLSLGLILQVHVTTNYPDHLSLTTWMCLMASVQSGVLTLIVEPNTKSAWKLNSSLELLCCLFAGLASVVTYFGQVWCTERRGPLFSAMFRPLSTVIVTILACIFLYEELYTGSLIGGLAVIIGLYVVLWGKAEDHGNTKDETSQGDDQTPSNTQIIDNASCEIDLEEPLLPEKSVN